MSPESCKCTEQAGVVCDQLQVGPDERAARLVAFRKLAREFARTPKAFIEFDRLVVRERKAIEEEEREERRIEREQRRSEGR